MCVSHGSNAAAPGAYISLEGALVTLAMGVGNLLGADMNAAASRPILLSTAAGGARAGPEVTTPRSERQGWRGNGVHSHSASSASMLRLEQMCAHMHRPGPLRHHMHAPGITPTAARQSRCLVAIAFYNARCYFCVRAFTVSTTRSPHLGGERRGMGNVHVRVGKEVTFWKLVEILI